MTRLRLENVTIKKAPGMPDGIPTLGFASGLSILVGPNASGKSTAARIIRSFIWSEECSPRDEASAHWRLAEDPYESSTFAGMVKWHPSRPHLPDGSAVPGEIARLGLRDLLEPHGEHERSFAKLISRELTGGLDLEQLEAELRHPESLNRRSAVGKNLQHAREALSKAERSAEEASHLEEQIAKAKSDVERLEALKQEETSTTGLIKYLQAHEQAIALEDNLGQYPTGMRLIYANDASTLEKIEQEKESLSSRIATTQAGIQKIRKQHTESRFPGQLPSDTKIKEWSRLLDELVSWQRDLDRLESDRANALARKESKSGSFLSEPRPQTCAEPPSSEDLSSTQSLIEDYRQERSKLAALEGELDAWTERARDHEQELDSARHELHLLRSWARAPSSDKRVPPWMLWLILVTGLAALLIGSATLLEAATRPLSGITLCLIGVGNLLFRAIAFTGNHTKLAGERTRFEHELSQGDNRPRSWDLDSVEESIRALEAQCSRIADAKNAQVQADTLGKKIERKEGELRILEEALTATLRKHGLPEDWRDLRAAEQLRRIKEFDDIVGEVAGYTKKIECLETKQRRRLDEWRSWFKQYDWRTDRDTEDPQLLFEELRDRLSMHTSACKDLSREEADLSKQEKDRNAIEARLSAFWEERSLTGHSNKKLALEERLNKLEAFRESRDKLAGIAATKEQYMIELRTVGAPPKLDGRDIHEVSSLEASQWLDQIQDQQAALGDPSERLGALNAMLEQAHRSQEMPDAIAEMSHAMSQVSDQRGKAIESALARLILKDACERHQSDHVPALLRDTRELFSTFTNHRWTLDVEADGTISLDDSESGESVSPEHLSDGTRVQLVLALRLAYLQSIGSNFPTLPLTIDEALSNADRFRFEAVATSLFSLADHGQQILYLTANHGEVEQWMEAAERAGHPLPQVVDLARFGGESTTPPPRKVGAPQNADLPPSPEGLGAAAYADQLKVSRPERSDQPESWHLYYACHTELDALYSALTQGIQTIGQWQNLRRATSGSLGIRPEISETIDHYASLTIETARQWSIGRNSTVHWDDLASSGAISETFEDRARKALDDSNGDPATLITKVGQLKGFRKKALDDLKTHLESLGVLATRAPLPRADIYSRVLANAPLSAEALGGSLARTHVEWLLDLLEEEAGE